MLLQTCSIGSAVAQCLQVCKMSELPSITCNTEKSAALETISHPHVAIEYRSVSQTPTYPKTNQSWFNTMQPCIPGTKLSVLVQHNSCYSPFEIVGQEDCVCIKNKPNVQEQAWLMQEQPTCLIGEQNQRIGLLLTPPANFAPGTSTFVFLASFWSTRTHALVIWSPIQGSNHCRRYWHVYLHLKAGWWCVQCCCCKRSVRNVCRARFLTCSLAARTVRQSTLLSCHMSWFRSA